MGMEYSNRHLRDDITSSTRYTISLRPTDIVPKSQFHSKERIWSKCFFKNAQLNHVDGTARNHNNLKMLQNSFTYSQVHMKMKCNCKYG